ncbi:putative short-subunit dehydrogenase-like oxidoreductase (DUF2520 family) [Anseongella ginsenosidimutans]|uniref:Putative short-subunit dehydrogenase-like oxidoreductase (DUF2520 family) n=1 Tax=Anseongella ginsenosidimutans TaxID=496056 RepID=A0A4R3KMD9_9SPHI|nr:DUF2520 domain-containing protein [Anseongella ginsenosidimutans]QEC52716.1 DUF2520 domain-containing protein [Anseongella ginsenosidimutans]TCS85465.1 putative short-subunit dehydrogenase-like oxidoreductase (DUF2520 family) [Anseongella ginsenosidimutans]
MRISIIGSGNVATHLGKAFYHSGHEIADICSPSPGHARALASLVNARALTQPSALRKDIDLCLIAVKDDVIEQLASALDFRETVVAHTAGSISMQTLSGSSPYYGVFYPFQTFSAFREPDISRVPFCLEANRQQALERLRELAESIGGKIVEVDSPGRKTLHLAAVFASNFTNHLYALAGELIREKGLPFDIMRSLILETAEKAVNADPFTAQTGPAVRNDQKVIREHLHQLEGQPALKQLYSLLSASILNSHKKPNI